MPVYVRTSFEPGEYHDYVIAGNSCNAFCLGEVGSQDDFFLVGSEPEPDSNFPMLTGNILGSDGKPLFRLVRNVLMINPGHCSKIISDRLGYEIHDGDGQKVFAVNTRWWPDTSHPDSKLITTLSGNFHDKSGALVFKANSGEDDERIESATRTVFGFTGSGFSYSNPTPTREEREFIGRVLTSRGAIHEPVRGQLAEGDFNLEGKCLIDVEATGVTIHVSSGNFSCYGKTRFRRCNFVSSGEAKNLEQLFRVIWAAEAAATRNIAKSEET